MAVQTIRTRIAVAAAAVAVSLGSAAVVASAGFAAAPASASATGSSGGAAVQSAQITRATQDDPHGSFDNGAQHAFLCATAIEYGLIA
jgi:pectate lyase